MSGTRVGGVARRPPVASVGPVRRERRAERRGEERAEVRIWLGQVPGFPSTFSRAADLSAGGMYVDLGLPRPRGTRTRVRFTLPDTQNEIVATCEVVGAESSGDLFGSHLRFVDLSPADRRRINNFVARRRRLAVIEEALRA